jgi:hypothetical protein
MAKATLTFDLSDSDDVMEHLRCVKSTDMALALWEIIYNSKKSLKHEMSASEFNKDKKELDAYEAIDLVYKRIYEILDEHDIVVSKLIN